MNESPDLNRLNIDPSQPVTNEEIARRLVRLIVGIVLTGQDALRYQLPIWEAEAARLLEASQQQKNNPPTSASGDTTKPSEMPWFPKSWEYRLIGLAFESPSYLKAGLVRLTQTQQTVWRKTAPLRLPLDILGVTDFAKHWLEGFLEWAQADGERLEKIGEAEAQASRALGQVAVLDIFDIVLDYLSENQEVQDLIKSQTNSMTEEVIGEVRERTVSADTLIETVIRRLLKKPYHPPEKMQFTSPDNKRQSNW
jgi:hypothetical protein